MNCTGMPFPTAVYLNLLTGTTPVNRIGVPFPMVYLFVIDSIIYERICTRLPHHNISIGNLEGESLVVRARITEDGDGTNVAVPLNNKSIAVLLLLRERPALNMWYCLQKNND